MTAEEAAEVDAKQQELFALRSKRDAAPAGQATPDEVAALAPSEGKPLHSTTAPGILALATAPCAPDASPALIATGGADHAVVCYSLAEDRVLATLTGHAKKVTALAFSTADALVSGSADGTVKLWRCGGDSGDAVWAQRSAALAAFDAPVKALCVHPLSKFVLAAAASGAWKLLDLSADRAVWSEAAVAADGVASAAVHPDGNFFALGSASASGGLAVYDVKTAKELTRHREGLNGAVSSIAFHENGFWAALACQTSVHVLDLRKFKQAVEVVPFDGDVTCLDWDHSGKYLACGGPAVQLYDVTGKGKKRGAEAKELVTLAEGHKKGVHCLSFAKLGHELYVGGADHNLRVYSC